MGEHYLSGRLQSLKQKNPGIIIALRGQWYLTSRRKALSSKPPTMTHGQG